MVDYPNIFAQGQDAFNNAYASQKKIGQDYASKQAAGLIAAGDYSGGANAFNQAGMIDQAHNVLADQQVLQDRQTTAQNTATDRATKLQQQKLEAFGKLADMASSLPQGQRLPWLQQHAQDLTTLGLPADRLSAMTEADLSDQSLAAFKAALGKSKLQFLKVGENQVGVDDQGNVRQTFRGNVIAKKDENIYAPDNPGYGPPPPPPGPQAAASPPPTASPALASVTPQDRDRLARMMVTEAGGEGPQGMAAVAHVALNRLNTGYGGAKSLSDVVDAPHQFEGMSRAASVHPQDLARASAVAERVLSGQEPDPTNGAMQFLNPELQAKLGRAQPAWADGSGVRLGRHVFYGGQAGAAPQGTDTLQGGAAGDAVAPSGYHLLASGAHDPEEAPLTDSAVKLQAGMYLKTGQMPPLGMGKSAHADRVKIMNEMDSLAKSLGLTADDIVSGTVSMKAAAKGLDKATTLRSQVEGSEATVNKNAQLALSLAPKGGGPTGMPVLNRVIQHIRGQYAGDPDVSAYEAAIGTVAEEYSKVMTTNTGTGGATSDSARKTAYDRLSSASTLPQLRSVISTLQTEMQNRATSLRDVEEGLRSQVRGANSAAPLHAAASPPLAPPPPPAQRPPLSAFQRR